MSDEFNTARAKLWIGSLDKTSLEVRAQYNPKELQIDKTVPWEEHGVRGKQEGSNSDDSSRQSDLEFNGAPKRSMTIELLFDSYEEENKSVEGDIRALEEMSSVQPEPRNSDKHRPHHCIVAWGETGGNSMRPFRCVIASLTTKYMMWNHAGMPVRAICTVKLTEALKMAGAEAAQERYGEKEYRRR